MLQAAPKNRRKWDSWILELMSVPELWCQGLVGDEPNLARYSAGCVQLSFSQSLISNYLVEDNTQE
ncbi:hypothetical protein TUM17377_18190 [Shewanella chilikensis]|nr:hypothetical protein TUM17377_18190 [Shewanella chilikensis]GHB13990.1 hypothetical protein GCM10007107_28730 [Shewanella indica]